MSVPSEQPEAAIPAPAAHHPILVSDLALLVASFFWGTTFVAQRAAMAHMGPLAFNGIRFLLGSLVLLPPAVCARRRRGRSRTGPQAPLRTLLAGGVSCGLALCVASNLQQIGIQYTTAGNAGFITGLYVIFIPVLGLVVGRRAPAGTWLGAALAAAGLYLLSVTADLRVNRGDVWVFVSAFFWACQILVVGYFSPRIHSLELASLQFAVCGALGLLAGVATEELSLAALFRTLPAILYAGVFSAGIAFTLQIVAQRHSPPAHAAIIMSLEAVFAAVAGWLMLGESLGPRALAGCGLMLAGMILSQIASVRSRPRSSGAEAPAPPGVVH